jgi:VWFA-related protein
LRYLPAVAALAFLLFALPAAAAEPVNVEIVTVEEQAGQAGQPGHLSVSITVVDGAGRAIGGLSTPNFRISLEGSQLVLDDVLSSASSRVPASVLLLVDVSGSMAGQPMTQAKAAMQEFVRNLDPSDQVAIMTFSNEVRLLQEFTADRAVLNQAITRLAPLGDTALYDGVLQAAAKIATVPGSRRMVVLLSDGLATANQGARNASIQAAGASGVSFVALGLGAGVDRQYLTELASASGGRFLDAPTPASLRQVYLDLASAIKSQYTLVVNSVPVSIDRTLPSKLTITANVATGAGTAERVLPPLAGATPPPIELALEGLADSQALKAATTVQPKAPAGITFTQVQYVLDGNVVQVASAEPFGYSIDPATLAVGKHLLLVIATDARGRRGELQVSFSIAAPASPLIPVPRDVLLAIAAVLGALALLILILRKRRKQVAGYAGRIKPWAGRVSDAPGPIEDWPQPLAPAAPAQQPAALRGRVVVMDEAAIRSGRLDVITEYEIGSTPLTFGTGAGCDIRVEDDENGRIAAEEARLWVRGDRLVYHKLTTLSAMATEGVTSGWQFLESGEDMRIGPYRIVFQLDAPVEEFEQASELPAEPLEPPQPPQEHGMALHEPWTAT